MSILKGTSGADAGAISSTSVTVDSGSNRLFIAGIGQFRSPPNLSGTPTLNSVAPSGYLNATTPWINGTTTTANFSFGAPYWTETDLPAAGSYTLAWSGSSTSLRVQWINYSGVSDEAAEDAADYASAGNGISHTGTADPYTADSLAIFIAYESGGDISGASAGTFLQDGTLIAAAYRTDGAGLTFTLSSTDDIIGAYGAFKAAASAPAVNNIDTDNVVYPGQNAVANGVNLAGISSVVYKNPSTLLEVTQTIGTPTATTVPHTVVRGGHAFTKDQDGNSLGGRDPLTAVFTE